MTQKLQKQFTQPRDKMTEYSTSISHDFP